MKRITLSVYVALFLAVSIMSASGGTALGQGKPLDIREVMDLVKAKLPENVIINFVDEQKGQYSLSGKDLIALRDAGASTSVITAMQKKSGAVPAAPVAAASSDTVSKDRPLNAAEAAAKTESRATSQTTRDVCDVRITDPKQGERVGAEGRVRGIATVPPGTHLWVMAHMKDLAAEWWPQGGRPAVIDPQDKTWVIIAGYGQARDAGEQFEVAAVVVNDGTNALLKKWFEDSVRRNSYPPISFPDSVQGCVPVKVTIVKTTE